MTGIFWNLGSEYQLIFYKTCAKKVGQYKPEWQKTGEKLTFWGGRYAIKTPPPRPFQNPPDRMPIFSEKIIENTLKDRPSFFNMKHQT